MAVGDISFFTIGFTASDGASTRKRYPIKRLYRQTAATSNPIFPSSYELFSSQKYWAPYISINSADTNYVPYTDGDEYGWSDNDAERAKEIPVSAPKTNKFSNNYPVNHRIVYNNEIYVATDYYFDWATTKFAANLNPYKTSRVRKWKKLTDTNPVWTQYWYHPLLQRFYTLAETASLQELPNFDEPNQTRWDKFIGDAKDMNLQNFTFAQIRELVSRGVPQDVANSTIGSIDNRAVNGQASSSVATTSNGQTSATLVVKRDAPNAGLSSAADVQIFPKMIQRRVNPNTGEKTSEAIYEFNLRPNNVTYSNIGVTWTDIERVNNVPLIDYKTKKLMKISFEFVVEAYAGNVSSLYLDCENRLQTLKNIADAESLVVFTDFDSLFSDASLPQTDINKYREWAIVDMSINSVQRTRDAIDGAKSGAISRATVSMTIQEVRLSSEAVIFMPKLPKDPKRPPTVVPPGKGDKDLCRISQASGVNRVKAGTSECKNTFARPRAGTTIIK